MNDLFRIETRTSPNVRSRANRAFRKFHHLKREADTDLSKRRNHALRFSSLRRCPRVLLSYPFFLAEELPAAQKFDQDATLKGRGKKEARLTGESDQGIKALPPSPRGPR